MPAGTKLWRLVPHDSDAIGRVSRETGVSPIVAQLLLNRGLAEPAAIQRFLRMPFDGLHPPALLDGLNSAVDRLLAAIHEGKRICVYGDYDVDGLTGTAILWQTLRLLGANVDFYVPHRLEEGYGLNSEAIQQIASTGAAVMVTVDCGIASIAEAEEARLRGLELIVTDHHEMKDRLPDAAAVVHPRIPGTRYPFGELSGSGVAFKLAWGLCQRACGSDRVTERYRDFLHDGIGLAALGMIADCVPLVDENRIVVRHGLQRLRANPSIGFQALLEAAGLAERQALHASDVSYFLAPRLNAAGRLGCARLVVELLTTASKTRATEIARFLESQNVKRQAIERTILEQAEEQIGNGKWDSASVLVLASPEWHAGVIGIVAGRLAERHGRPALLIALRTETGLGHGSGRSVPGFRMHEALHACGECLVGHGGHASAVGFKIQPDQVDVFRERICNYASERLANGPRMGHLVLDAELPLSSLTSGLVDALGRLEPYGIGNPRPRLLAGPVEIVGAPRRVGKGERHLQFRVKQQECQFPAIAFGMGDRAEELAASSGACSLAFTPTFNEWQGRRTIQLEIADFQPVFPAKLD